MLQCFWMTKHSSARTHILIQTVFVHQSRIATPTGTNASWKGLSAIHQQYTQYVTYLKSDMSIGKMKLT